MDQPVSLVKVDVGEFALDGSVPECCLLPEYFLHFVDPVAW